MAHGTRIPLPDNCVSEVYSRYVFEHLDDPGETIRELYRISKNGALWYIHVPHFSSPQYWNSFDHKRGFSVNTFCNHDINFCERKNIPLANIETVKVRLRWWDDELVQQKGLAKRSVLFPFNWLFSSLANLHPFLCDRIWCRWVGGFNVVVFTLRVVK